MLNVRLPIPRLYTAQETYIGGGSLGIVRLLSATKIFIVISNSIANDETLRTYVNKSVGSVALVQHIKKSGEASLSEAKEIAAKMALFRPDWILAIGGGSVIDVAKLAWVFFENPDFIVTGVDANRLTFNVRSHAKFIVAPTTAGTGSEVSSAAVYFNEANEKFFLVSHDLIADIVILDTKLVEKLPKHVIAASGLDALAHLIEGFVSIYKNKFLDIQAISAAQTILKNFHRFFDNPKDSEAAESMLISSLQAGWVQNMKIPGMAHALAHQLGKYGVGHGLACGYFLLSSILYNSQDERISLQYQEFAKAIGVIDCNGLEEAICELIQYFLKDNKFAQLWKSCEEIFRKNIDEIIKNSLNDICAKANPLPLDAEKMKYILENKQVICQ